MAGEEHRYRHQDEYEDEQSGPQTTYRTIYQEVADLEAPEHAAEKTLDLVEALVEEARQRAGKTAFSGLNRSMEREDHSGNLWPGPTWLLNENPRDNTVSALNIHDYHRHLLRSASNKTELNADHHRVDYSLARQDRMLHTQLEESMRQGAAFGEKARAILETEPDPEARAEQAQAMAALVAGPALEAEKTVGHPTGQASAREIEKELAEALARGDLENGQAADAFRRLREIVEYGERVESLRAPDPHTMYTVADQRWDQGGREAAARVRLMRERGIENPFWTQEERERMNAAIRGDFARMDQNRQEAFRGDPTADHRYDPATVRLLLWAMENGELSQWAEAPATGQEQWQIERTVLEITRGQEQTLATMSEPPGGLREIDGSMARWAISRGLSGRWLESCRQDAGAPEGTEGIREWSEVFQEVMNDPAEGPEAERRKTAARNAMQLVHEARGPGVQAGR